MYRVYMTHLLEYFAQKHLTSLFLLFFFLIGGSAYSQTSLSLASGTAAPGGSLALNLSLSASTASALEWTLSYAAADVTSVTVAAGPALAAAGKTIQCSTGAGSTVCLASGINSTMIANGVVAVVTATLAAAPSGASVPISVGSTMGSLADGSAVAVSGTGGTITVQGGPPPDTIAPSVPTALSATPISASQINLAWTASTDNVATTGYKVFRAGVQIATVPGTTYQNTGLTAATAYPYTVSAFDAAGNNSAQGPSVSATTQAASDTIAPSVPTNLSATAMSASQINLSWTASTDNVATTGYLVLRAGAHIATVTVGTTYQNTSLIAGTAYPYTVSAFDAAGNNSAQSAAVSATTQAASDTTAPSVPTALSATATSASQINLSWTASTDNVATTGYTVFRAGLQIATVLGTTYQNTGLTASTAYAYTVSAFDAAGNNSAQSASVSATTQAAGSPSPQTFLLIHSDASELSGVTNGSTVTPGIAPPGFTGKVVVNGAGSVNFTPAQTGNGVYFLTCCANAGNAYYKFSGASVGSMLDVTQGQISFYLKSRYSFAQRKASAASPRYAFDVRDGNGHLFNFLTQVTQGHLQFTYAAGGALPYYFVPSGTEDVLFGIGVTLKVTIAWSGTVSNLYLNDKLVASGAYTIPTPGWTAASTFDLGAYEYLSFGGYNSSDDVIDEFTVTGPASPTGTSLWSSSTVPAIPWSNDASATLGLKFRSDVSGSVTGIRFYKGAGNTGTHTGLLYSSTGTPLAQATFTAETAAGWQVVNFPSAVSIAANTTYIAAFFSTSGYAYNLNYFTSSGADSPPLHALRSGVDGPNGVYVYGGTPQFPSFTFADVNYWVDLVFTAN
jgi:chitodextrinase